MNVVLLLVLATEPSLDATSSAMAASAADGLQGRARVELERVSTLPGDDEAVHRAKAASASAVVEISWPDANGLRAHLHAHLRPTGPWLDRDMSFETTSSSWERGRAVGLAIAAMIPDDEASVPSAPIVTVTPIAPTKPEPDRVEPPPTASLPGRTRRYAWEAMLTGELGEGFRGDPIGGGGRLAGTWWFHPRLGARVDLGGRFSSVPAANAHVVRVDGGLGLTLHLLGVPGGTGIAIVGGARVARVDVGRPRFDGFVERRNHILPFLALSIEGALSLGSRLAGVAVLGSEVALGNTSLAVRDTTVGALPTAAVVLGLGLRLGL